MIVSPNVRPLNKLETRRFPPVEDITITANAEIPLVVEVQQEAVAGRGALRTLRGRLSRPASDRDVRGDGRRLMRISTAGLVHHSTGQSLRAQGGCAAGHRLFSREHFRGDGMLRASRRFWHDCMWYVVLSPPFAG